MFHSHLLHHAVAHGRMQFENVNSPWELQEFQKTPELEDLALALARPQTSNVSLEECQTAQGLDQSR